MPHSSLLIIQNTNEIPHPRLAIFDLDDTLIKYYPPHIKQKFAFLYESASAMLKETSKTHSIVIFSNQHNVISQKNEDHFRKKIQDLMDAIDVPVLFIAALEQDNNRKPSTGMLEYVRSVSSVDIESSFFVGDAAGRNSDHSDCDLKIAINMGMRFYTPEEFFLGRKEVLNVIFYDLGCDFKRQEFENTLRMVVRGNKNFKEQEEDKIIVKNINSSMSKNQEILDKIKSQESDVIFVYGKGNLTGKSYFAKCYFKDYKIIRDSKSFVPGEKNIYLNCMDKYFLLKYKKSPCVFLNYSNDALKYLKIFNSLTGKQSYNYNKKSECFDFKRYFESVHDFDFIYNTEMLNDTEKFVSDLTL